MVEPEEGGGELAATPVIGGATSWLVTAVMARRFAPVSQGFLKASQDSETSGIAFQGCALHFDHPPNWSYRRSHVVSKDTSAQSEPVAWRAIVYDTPVFASDGDRVGIVREVLGSDSEDIFHGLRIELAEGGRHVMILADDVKLITKGRIETGLASAAIAALPAYREEETYHLASVGWLRRHLGWKRDSESDEEPGGTR